MTPKSSPRSFRISEDLYESIESIARTERVSTSQIANKALRGYIEWQSAPSTRGLVSVPATLLNKLMDFLSTRQAHELGLSTGAELFISSMKTLSPRLDLETAVNGFRRLSTYGRRFEFDHQTKENHHTLFIRHGAGINWSFYYGGAIEGIFGEYLGYDVVVKESSKSCHADFET